MYIYIHVSGSRKTGNGAKPSARARAIIYVYMYTFMCACVLYTYIYTYIHTCERVAKDWRRGEAEQRVRERERVAREGDVKECGPCIGVHLKDTGG